MRGKSRKVDQYLVENLRKKKDNVENIDQGGIMRLRWILKCRVQNYDFFNAACGGEKTLTF
jgi:hypothetical protein